VLRPSNAAVRAFRVLCALFITALAIELPTRLCFGASYANLSAGSVFHATLTAWTNHHWFDVAFDAAMWLDLVGHLLFFAQLSPTTGELLHRPSQLYAHYDGLWWDVVSLLPLDWALYFAGADANVMLICRIARLVRVRSLPRFFDQLVVASRESVRCAWFEMNVGHSKPPQEMHSLQSLLIFFPQNSKYSGRLIVSKILIGVLNTHFSTLYYCP
jgi:hypothetical protein